MSLAGYMEEFLFFEIFHVPLLILGFISAGLYFTLRLGFPNVRLFKHGLEVAFTKKYYSPRDPGEISPKQALLTSLSSAIGLGNITGVAVAVSVGGPGAVIWMMIMAFFGMSTVFAEAILSHKYRYIFKDGHVNGGPFRYLKQGLTGLKHRNLGVSLSIIFAILGMFSSLGGGAIFQTHEAINVLTEFHILKDSGLMLSLIFALFTGFVMMGGIKRLSKVMDEMVPFMTIFYVLSCLVVIFINFDKMAPALLIMFEDAFAIKSINAGFLGTLINGVRRSSFSNEAGLGTAPIVYATTKSKESVMQASVAILNPFFDTIIVCFMTGLVIVVSGVYNLPDAGDGVVLTKNAFATVSTWFPVMLSVAIVLFATSTIMGSAYSAQSSWIYMFGKKSVYIYNVVYCLAVFFAYQIDFSSMISIADTCVLSMAVPNLIGLFMLRKIVRREYDGYMKKLTAGEFGKKRKVRKKC